MNPEQLAGVAALVTAAATVIGAITLVLFFRVGGRWGRLNDAASVVLMLGMIPVALVVAAIESEVAATAALVVAAIGIVGMVVAGGYQAALTAGRITYEQGRRPTLGAGVLVGIWYILAGLLAGGTVLAGPLAVLAIAAGAGFVATGYGFLVGDEKHPLSAIGGLVLFLASLGFLAGLGAGLVGGGVPVPAWNA